MIVTRVGMCTPSAFARRKYVFIAQVRRIVIRAILISLSYNTCGTIKRYAFFRFSYTNVKIRASNIQNFVNEYEKKNTYVT